MAEKDVSFPKLILEKTIIAGEEGQDSEEKDDENDEDYVPRSHPMVRTSRSHGHPRVSTRLTAKNKKKGEKEHDLAKDHEKDEDYVPRSKPKKSRSRSRAHSTGTGRGKPIGKETDKQADESPKSVVQKFRLIRWPDDEDEDIEEERQEEQ